ncbi:MAG: hypothetical protein ACI92S_003093, partial [Planctomycetaceae bacterium]
RRVLVDGRVERVASETILSISHGLLRFVQN